MKSNRYIYIIDWDKDSKLLFNGLNKKFIIFPSILEHTYKLLLSNPDKYLSSHPKIINQLFKKKFLIGNDVNEKEVLMLSRKDFIDSKEYKTTIIPTFECNYACWYCVQTHTPLNLECSKFDLIIRHIKKYLLSNHISSYVLSWFGGEPLTQPDIIDYVSKNLKDFCLKNNIEYSASLTSNGALLTEKTIRMLEPNFVDYYQIALDGDEKTHNSIKHMQGEESSFQTILTNISNLLEINSRATVTLRLNYTLAMLNSPWIVEEICEYIPTDSRSRIVVDLQKVWQIKEDSIPMDKLFFLQKKLSEAGFRLETNHVFAICYVEKKHYNMFYYNGGVEKCDKRPIDKLRGYINEEGDIIWSEKPIFQDYNLFDENCVCNDCNYYPLCYNGCPILREERITENGKIICGHNKTYDLLEQRILDYCHRVLCNRQLLTKD